MAVDLGLSDLLLARAYLRVSFDRSGEARSVVEQDADLGGDAECEGWRMGVAYSDVAVSASRYSTKIRGDFEALIADLEADRFGADLLLLWESSRGSRRVGEWVQLLDLCEQRRVRIWVHTHGRLYDPANGRDRRTLIEDAADSEYESYKTSTRVRRTVAAAAVAGRPAGRTPFGWLRRYDEKTGKLAGQEPHPDESPVVVELFRRLHAGHSLKSITRDFAKDGVVARTGRPFTAQHLRKVALCPTHAGLRVHCPAGGDRYGATLDSLHEGTWDPLIDPAIWYAVQRVLRAPERHTGRDGRARHWLSRIARCDRCGGPMSAITKRKKGSRDVESYVCGEKGCVSINKADTDKEVARLVLGFLADPTMIDLLRSRDEGADAELAEIREQLAVARTAHDELADEVKAGRLTPKFAARSEPGILDRIATLEARQRELSTPSALRALIEPGADVAERWADLPITTARQVAKLLLVPGLLGSLRIMPTPGPGIRVNVEKRFRWITDTDTDNDAGEDGGARG